MYAANVMQYGRTLSLPIVHQVGASLVKGGLQYLQENGHHCEYLLESSSGVSMSGSAIVRSFSFQDEDLISGICWIVQKTDLKRINIMITLDLLWSLLHQPGPCRYL